MWERQKVSSDLLRNDESILHQVLQGCSHRDVVEGVGNMEDAVSGMFDNSGG